MFLIEIYVLFAHICRVMKLWKTILIIVPLLCQQRTCYSQPENVSVMFWNCENFFDYEDSGAGESDHEFSPGGKRHWTSSRFYAKCSLFAKTVLLLKEHYGYLPDVIALAEIENRSVLERMLYSTALRKLDYRIIHYDSQDHRGIDCAILYRPNSLKLLSSKPCRIDSLRTRDILLAQFILPAGDSLVILVNHHPSKYGGAKSAVNRRLALERLRDINDSLVICGWKNSLTIGDFNEDAENALYAVLEPSLVQVSPMVAELPGTIRFNGKWERIDLVFSSPKLLHRVKYDICVMPHLLEWDSSHSGMKPKRTYSGPRYIGGFSDHLPIWVNLMP